MTTVTKALGVDDEKVFELTTKMQMEYNKNRRKSEAIYKVCGDNLSKEAAVAIGFFLASTTATAFDYTLQEKLALDMTRDN